MRNADESAPFAETAICGIVCAVWRLIFALGAASGFVGVAAGAFGAHVLRPRLEPDALQVFELAARYQLTHALAILAAAWFYRCTAAPASRIAGWCFILGTLVFSGSLYALALSGIKWLGAITPLGGAALLAGWAALAWAGLRESSRASG